MDLKPDLSTEAFRAEVQRKIALHWPESMRNQSLSSRESMALAARTLNKMGYVAPNWPNKDWGGAALNGTEQHILSEELGKVDFPRVDGIGFSMAAPVIHAFGSLAQKKRYLSAMVKGEEIWCQGFSEPDSGSDVSSLRTTATKSGNDYIIEGQKTWTSNAHNADMMFALVKVKRGASLMTGLTYILVDMKDPNVEVRPIITVDGEHRFNEVFLNKVRVPATNVVGEVGKGWKNARFLLKSERVLVSQSAATRKRLKAVKKAAAERIGGSLQADPVMYRKISQLEIELRALETTVLRTLFTQQANPGDPALDGLTNVLKLRGSELRQRVGDLIVEVMGDEGLILDQEANGRSHTQDQVQNLFDVTATLAGGSSEIQRNLIANIALGLSGR